MTKEAEEIAKKLDRQQPEKPNRHSFSVAKEKGKRHLLIKISYDGKFLFQYGIRNGSGQQGHDYIPEQLRLSKPQAYDLAKCPFSVDDFIDHLIAIGEIEAPAAEE
jgi:hypothetical protein